ncbi:MAG: M56 family metallopeptidase [bacterium]
MSTAWILYLLLVGTLLACAALSVDGILRRISMPTRWVWLAALGGIVALAILAPRRETSGIKIDTLVARVSDAMPANPATSIGVLAEIARAREVITSSVSSALAVAGARIPQGVVLSLGAVWILLSGAVLCVLVIVSRRVNRARRSWPTRELHGTPVRIAPATGPAVIGFSRPEIVVPSWLFERTADEQRLVIVHEHEHVKARDQLLLVGGWIVAVLLPWHPAVWWSFSRMRLAIELDCDARVLRQGVKARPYGSLLIDIAGQCAGHRVGALALADKTSHLERRLLAMKNTKRRFTIVPTLVLGAIALMSVAMACEARLPTSAEVQQMDVASAERAATQAKLIDEKSANVTYTVNGKAVSAAEAHALSANLIATVNVLKSKQGATKDAGSAETVVNIVTTDGLTSFRKRESGEASAEKGFPMTISYRKGQLESKLVTEHSTLPDKKAFTGLVLIDGVRVSNDAFSKLSPSEIESVEVMKGEAATRAYSDPAAANGVITIKTKSAKQ